MYQPIAIVLTIPKLHAIVCHCIGASNVSIVCLPDTQKYKLWRRGNIYQPHQHRVLMKEWYCHRPRI